ncbi:mannosyltransferase [Salinihabitans flavidus]|uniref:Mannosyltransferase n=1 Tax=Salinihabitans flavidus TaxID=569882 RepID=A0A1H8LI35_9RHOB|nr:glycosyltransferase family 4 protein [Salinihabitans flavidus]SEO04719.1 mannosyltransferase [Salinihabitans flavidus]
MRIPGKDIEVIAPNFSRRLSGVTATVAALVPRQARIMGVVATGVGLPEDVPRVPFWRVPFLARRRRVWHARRNNEMLVGFVLRALGVMQLKLVFTSSSPRRRGGLTRWMTQRMDAIVATTPANAEVMPGDPVIIPHGVDTDRFAPGSGTLFTAAEGERLIGCFGRVREMKGTHHFVEAMCRVLPDRPEWSAVIMGRVKPEDEPYAARLRERITAAGLEHRIRFHPEIPVERMPDAYRALSLYVAPSLLEGFGLTPLEALSCGVPVVATDVGAFADFVTEDCGAIVPKDDAGALTEAIRATLARDVGEMGGAGRARVVAEFGLEREAEALCALYRALLAGEGRTLPL